MSLSIRRPLGVHLRWIRRIWKPYRWELPALLGLTLINGAVLVLLPLFLKWVVDDIEQQASLDRVLRNVGLLIGYGIVHFIIYFALQYIRARQNMRFEYTARMRGFEHVLDWGRSNRLRYRTGDVITRLTDDVSEKLSWYLCSGIGRVIEAGAIIVCGVAMMLWLNPYLTLLTAGPLPILIGLFVATASTLHKKYAVVQKTISDLNGTLESCFSGVRVVKAFGAEGMQHALLDDAIEKQREAEVRAVRWQTVIDSLYGNVWQLGIVGVLLAGGWAVIKGRITLGELIAFDSYVLMLVWPMFDIGQFLVRGKLSRVTVDRLIDLEEAPPEVHEREPEAIPMRTPDDAAPADYDTPKPLPPLPVRFEHVSYRYPEQTDHDQTDIEQQLPTSDTPERNGAEHGSLTAIDFEAKPGEITAIVGEVGAGKSTLLSLVPRLADPSSGRIVIGSEPVPDWHLPTLRMQMGYVPQEPELLSGTIGENIRFGREWVTEEDITWAIELAQLTGDLSGFPQGLETVVGSGGVRLSGGQKQRVSLARALAGRPRVLLLDDCTASLDAQTEMRVWNRLLDELPECVVLLVTHRPATLERADRLIVLKRGRIVERGRFDDLFRDGTELRRLHERYTKRVST